MYRFIYQDLNSNIPKIFFIFSIIFFVLMFVLFLILNVDMDNYVYKITETIKQGKMCDGTNCLLSGNRESNEILGALEEGIVVIKDEKIIYSNDIFDIIMALTKEKP